MKLTPLLVLLSSLSVLQGCVGVAILAGVGGATVANDERTVGQQIDDQNIEFKAYEIVNNNKDLAEKTNIQITSMNGSLLIVGQAPTTALRDLAVTLLSEIKPIKQVHNQLRVANITSVATRTNDAWLTSKVKTALFASENLEASKIKVVTENAEVFLMGIVTTTEANAAVNVARNVTGVNRVFKAFEYQ